MAGRLAASIELEALQQLVGAALRLAAGHVVQLAHHLQVLEAGEVLVDGGVLPRQADLRAERRGVLHHVQADDAGGAAVGLEQRGEDADGGGLAGPVGSEQAEDGPGTRGEVHAAQGANRSVRLLQALDDDRVITHETPS